MARLNSSIILGEAAHTWGKSGRPNDKRRSYISINDKKEYFITKIFFHFHNYYFCYKKYRFQPPRVISCLEYH